MYAPFLAAFPSNNGKVLLVLPPLAKLRSIVERYRSMSDVVGISANKKGTLQLTVQTQRIRADTAWNGLTNVADKKISTDDALSRCSACLYCIM
jgi:hypothetical protein